MTQSILPLDASKRDDSEDSFIASASNSLAKDAIDRWPEWSSPVLIITGGRACGKSHLGAIWANKAGARDFFTADKSSDQDHTPLLVDIDDWQKVDESTLFHAYQHVITAPSSMLILLPKTPNLIDMQLPDLASRLLATPTVAIESPDDLMVPQLLFRHLAMRQLVVSPSVISYISKRIERSYKSIAEIAEKLDQFSMEQKKPITVNVVKQLMAGEA